MDTGNYRLLAIGKKFSIADADIVWEDIVRRNNEGNANFNYQNYFELVRSLGQLINNYTLIKACIIKLRHRPFDEETIQILADKGYKVRVGNQEEYFKSLEACSRKSDNLVTKINSKQKEIVEMSKGVEDGKLTFDEAIATVSSSIGFEVREDITLARFNEYKKIINKRHGRDNKTGTIKR